MEKKELISKMVEEKEFDKIYDLFGRSVYLKVTPREYQKQDVEKLFAEQKYGEIYNKYGKLRKVYVKNFEKIKNQDIKRLLSEGRFEDIRSRYGEKEYNKHLNFMNKQDVYGETGKKKKKLHKLKTKLAIGVASAALLTQAAIAAEPVITLAGINMYNQNVARENIELYAEKVAAYEQSIQEYAEEVRSMNLNDLQTIMKVINDIWKNTEYGNPQYDIYGIQGLDVYEKGPVLCRNIADDFMRKMNAINSRYDVKTISVNGNNNYFDNVIVSNVQRNVTNRKYVNMAPDKKKDHAIENITEEVPKIGNHIVNILTLSDGMTICVDPTNPAIGLIKGDKIKMLSSDTELEYKNYGTVYIMPFDASFKYNLASFKEQFNNKDEKYYEDNYGVHAQNEALNFLSELENEKKVR